MSFRFRKYSNNSKEQLKTDKDGMKISSARGKKDITQTRMRRLIVDFSAVVIM